MRQVPGHLEVFNDSRQWVQNRQNEKSNGETLGFVPTMGALHEGHLSLVRRSKSENDRTLVSIFVNPTQFDDANDLTLYPRTFEKDLEMLRAAGADYVLSPRAHEIYADNYRFKVTENELSHELCGAHRPGHFDGVLTVVMKLLNLADAERAYFGEKDFQQYTLVQQMVEAFFMRTKIIGCPTVRESDGLAMSSRNMRLQASQRALAARFAQILLEAGTDEEARKRLEDLGFEVDYVTHLLGRRLGAVRLGPVRLIDNIPDVTKPDVTSPIVTKPEVTR